MRSLLRQRPLSLANAALCSLLLLALAAPPVARAQQQDAPDRARQQRMEQLRQSREAEMRERLQRLPTRARQQAAQQQDPGDSENVSLVGRYAEGPSLAVDVQGDLAYFGNGSYLEIANFSDPSNPIQQGRTLLPDFPRYVTVGGEFVYVVDGGDYLRVVDVSDPTNPQEVGAFDTGSYVAGMDVAGDLVYIATVDGLIVVDVSNPTAPQEVSTFDPESSALGIAVASDVAYVADFGGIRVVDVSDPADLQEVGAIDFGFVPTVRGVATAGDFVYVIDPNNGLRVVNVSDPADPHKVGAEFDNLNLEPSVAVNGDFAYFTAGSGGLRVADVSDPADPQEIGVFNDRSAWDLSVAGNITYVASGNDGIRAVDTSNPINLNEVGAFETEGSATDVVLAGNFAYVAGSSGLRVIDVSDPTDPQKIGVLTGLAIFDVTVVGNFAYVAANRDGLRVLNIADPTDPREVGAFDESDSRVANVTNVTVANGFAYFDYLGLRVVDISDPSDPQEVGSLESVSPRDVTVANDVAYVASRDGGLQIIDVSDPTNPQKISSFATEAYGIAVLGNLAYVAGRLDGLRVVDISDPASPQEISVLSSVTPRDVFVVGDLVYISSFGGVRIIDVSTPTDPQMVGYYDIGGFPGNVSLADGLAYASRGANGLYVLDFTGEGGGEAPAPPTDLSAVVNSGEVELTWEASPASDLAEYHLYRGTSPQPTTQIATIAEGNTTYDDPDVSNGTTYYYRLTAVDADGNESGYSNEVSITPEAPPATPDLLQGLISTQEALLGDGVSGEFEWDDMREEYKNGVKHLAYLSAGKFIFGFGVYIDADDYVGITEEGSSLDGGNDGWVTIWVDGSIGIEAALPAFGGVTKIEYDEDNPDPLREFQITRPGATASSINIEHLNYEEGRGFLGYVAEFEPTAEFRASIALIGVGRNVARFEIKRSDLDAIVNQAATLPTGSGIVSGLDETSLRNQFIGFLTAGDLGATGEALYAVRDLFSGDATREFTLTDDGSPAEARAYIESSGGGIDANGDDVPDNLTPVDPLPDKKYGWSYLLNVRATGNEETRYIVEADAPEGWRVRNANELVFTNPRLSINEVSTETLTPGELGTTSWTIAAGPDATEEEVQVTFTLRPSGEETVLDELTITLERYDGELVAYNGRSPIELNVETPSGESIGPDAYDAGTTMYNQFDVDGSGDEDAQVLVASPGDGPYNAQVIPKDDAQPSDTYTLEAINEGEVTTLAEDVLIEDTPNDPYRYILGRPTTLTRNVNQSFGDAKESRDYRLVALPGDGSVSVASTLEGEAGTDWRVFYDNGQSGSRDDYLVEYENSDRFQFAPGRGFWMLSENAWQSSGEVETVSLGEDGAYAIDLHEGWNIISNPFGASVGWNQVTATHSDSLRALWRFDGSFARTDTFRSAKAGEAFYFLNDTGLDSLRVPYPSDPGVKAKQEEKEESPLLTISAQSEGSEGGSAVKVGFNKKAAGGLDRLDQPAPPGQFSAVSLRLEVPGEAPTRQRLLMTERRPPSAGSDEGQTFQLQLRAKTEGPVQITAGGLDAAKGSQIELLCPSTGRSYDLKAEKTVTLEEADSTGLKLAIGSAAYVQNQVEQIVPDEITLTSYPNPFRTQATVAYTLPEAADVQIAVYDMLGRQVAVLENGRREAGRHRVTLDGDRLASGVYFGRLHIGDQTRTQKMTVVR